MRILATLANPDGGRAYIDGYDVVREPYQVRARIGLAGQYAAVDERLTGRENLRLFARLHHLPYRRARARADELLEQFDLAAAADRPVRTYSGGMRRRLDLVSSLIVAPRVLFLDEPTTGLDPRSRGQIWDHVHALVADGTTVLLTTQYLDEADRLADEIAVVDHGQVISDGTPDALKSLIGDRLDVAVEDPDQLSTAMAVLGRASANEPVAHAPDRITVPLTNAAVRLADVVRELDLAGVSAADVARRRPTLDEVFLRLTARSHDEAEQTAAPLVTEEVR